MRGSQKSKRITWAPDVNLCQVRLFSTAKPPSEVGMGNRAYVQEKASRLLQPGSYEEGPPPPGFEEIQPANLWRLRSSQMPFTKWRCPPRFEVNSEWQVVSGEESKEIEAQNQRQRRVLEAIYPRPSAIPPDPRAPVDAGESISDDRNTPLVPLTPIEEADANNIAESTPQELQAENIVAAALASVLGDQMKLIDLDLLKRILSDPKLLQQSLYVPEFKLQPNKTSDDREAAASLNAAAGPFHPPQLKTGFDVHVRSAPIKDMNYYKSLIQQHGGGGERRDVTKARMISRPCIYFKTPKGCRNGAHCAYQHDPMSRVGCITEVPNAKRLKLSR